MSEGTSNSIVNLGELSKPADTLIKKVSKAVGGIFAPYQTKRMAKAEAEAAIVQAETEIKITEIHRRAMHRFIEEEAQRQQNIEEITSKAIPRLEEKATPDSIEDDWVTNFFDKSRIVSDEDMQQLWAKVLAGESNSPGTFSKRTVNFLGDLDKSDAEIFANLCSFCVMFGGIQPLIFDETNDFYTSKGVDFGTLSHLESIGLIQYSGIGSFARMKLPKKFAILYYGAPIELEMPKDTDNQIDLGKVNLTRIGEQLALICGSTAVDGFVDFVKEEWKQHMPNEAESGRNGD